MKCNQSSSCCLIVPHHILRAKSGDVPLNDLYPGKYFPLLDSFDDFLNVQNADLFNSAEPCLYALN